MGIIQKLYDENKLQIPASYILDTEYEVLMGSIAYGASMSESSDVDVHAFCIPDKEVVFPNIVPGYVEGFSIRTPNFSSFQQHHIEYDGKSIDVCVFSIVKLFELARENNPNVLDLLWVPDDCILKCSNIAGHLLDNRTKFLSKQSYKKFTGYAYGQLKKLLLSKRTEIIDKWGYDVKHAYHIIRLAKQAIDILSYGDMNLRSNSELLIDIRSGKYTFEEINQMFNELDSQAIKLLDKNGVRDSNSQKELETLLNECLEMKYGH